MWTAFELSSSAQQWAAVAFSKGTPDVPLARSRWDCIDLIVVPAMLRVPIAQPAGETTKFVIDRKAALIRASLATGRPRLAHLPASRPVAGSFRLGSPRSRRYESPSRCYLR